MMTTLFALPSPSGWGWASAAPPAPATSRAAAAMPRLELRFILSFSLYERLDVDVEGMALAAAAGGRLAAIHAKLDLMTLGRGLEDGPPELGDLLGGERLADGEDMRFAV